MISSPDATTSCSSRHVGWFITSSSRVVGRSSTIWLYRRHGCRLGGVSHRYNAGFNTNVAGRQSFGTDGRIYPLGYKPTPAVPVSPLFVTPLFLSSCFVTSWAIACRVRNSNSNCCNVLLAFMSTCDFNRVPLANFFESCENRCGNLHLFGIPPKGRRQ